ncbi:MAG: hypothetical protein JXA75_01805 [Candidatus Thermoplasmatota archaeon]|nr:hypothetical protein [Candidatus Thermoplasmatota archaeon]
MVAEVSDDVEVAVLVGDMAWVQLENVSVPTVGIRKLINEAYLVFQ